MENQISLTEDVIDAAEYFKELGYQVAPDFPELFFRCAKAMPEEERKSRSDASAYEDVFRSLLVRNEEEDASFGDDFPAFLERRRIVSEEAYDDMQCRNQERRSEAARCEKEIEKARKELKNAEKQAEKYEKLAESKGSLFTESEIKKAEKKMKKGGKELAESSGMSEKALASIFRNSKSLTKDKIKKYKDKLKKGAAKAIAHDNYKDIVALAKALAKMVDEADEKLNDDPAEHARKYRNKCENYMKTIKKNREELEKYKQDSEPVKVVKPKTLHHRSLFISNGNAVISAGRGEKEFFELLQKEFGKLNTKDFVKIRDYLRDHAQQFRTRVTRNIRTSERRKINFPETCRKACATGGVPIRLEMQKPKKSRTSIVMILDVSGSCRSSSVIMMNFMQTVSEVFGGGVHSFAFVNSLYDITDAFADGEEPAQILSEIPTKGVYSDYFTPLKQFSSEYMSLINSDTIVMFIGDARNNKNPTGEEYMKNICRRARSAYWINTESQDKWNKADSIMSVYAPYMRKYAPVLNTAELLSFLMEVK